jgi:hypothetical protein
MDHIHLQDKEGHWIQSYKHTARIEDNDKTVECSLPQGAELKSDKITLSILFFEPDKGKSMRGDTVYARR